MTVEWAPVEDLGRILLATITKWTEPAPWFILFYFLIFFCLANVMLTLWRLSGAYSSHS